VETLPISQIVVDTNSRRSMNPDRLKELTENIKKVGVLEPVLVRANGRNHVMESWTLIAGHRRLAAAKAAGLSEIPVRVLDVDEKQAQEIQALENLHREDLGPVDEARSFKALLDLGTHTVETLAARVDKSETYVYRALRLLELPEKVLKAIDDGILTSGHAHQLLRVPADRREALLKFVLEKDWHGHYRTVDDLKSEIDRNVSKDLDKAPFPIRDEYAGTVACTVCPFNSGNQGMLFDGAEKGSCTNGVCYAKKSKAYDQQLRAQGEKKFPGLEFVGSAVDRGWGDRVIGGALIVDKVDANVKAAMKKSPEKFGFGLLRPDSYAGGAPKLAIVCKDPELIGKKAKDIQGDRVTTEDYEKQRFIANAVDLAVNKVLLEKAKLEKEDIIEAILEMNSNVYGSRCQLIPAAGCAEDVTAEWLSTLDESLLQKILILMTVNENREKQLLKAAGVRIQDIEKAAKKAATAEWAERQKKSEKPK